MIRQPPKSTPDRSSAASDVYNSQLMPSPHRGRTRATSGTPRSCLHHTADELGPHPEHHAHAFTTPRTNSDHIRNTTLMPSPLRGRTQTTSGTPRSCLHHSADELRPHPEHHAHAFTT